jgi:hypothetical protein
MSLPRRVECFLFLAALLVYGWFNQGGGWNQNARFAEVRSIVDGGEIAIDNYFCYQRGHGKTLVRYPVINGDVTIAGKTSRLCWVSMNGDLIAVNGVEPPTDMDGVGIDDLACSGDVSFAMGLFHPNKPPGLSFVALPAYFIISHWERLMHRNPDTWWLLNVNAWLTSVFSVGLLSAAGVVFAFRIAMRLSGERLWPSFWAAIAFAFGTLFFPFGTLLFDHNVTTVFLVGAFYCLFQRDGARMTALAGFLAGMAAITNYVAAVPVAFLALYLMSTRREHRRWLPGILWYGTGLLGPFLAICAYNKGCYGSPFALSNAFQNPTFTEKGPVFLGMFAIPNPAVALILLISPFRGIFYGAPILAMGVYGLWRMRRLFPAEMWLFVSIALIFYVVNCSFFGWHAGFASGPRYLIPATAFMAIPTVFGLIKLPRLSGGLLIVSIGINFLFAATDAESPAGVGSLAMTRDREMYLYSPLMEYALPLFCQGRAWPILNLMIQERLDDEKERLAALGTITPEAQRPLLDAMDSELRESIRAGSDDPLELGAYVGPVSVNPTGVYEGGYFRLFDAGSPQALWSSFNVGEFWFPGSRWSVVILLGLVGLMGAALAREAVRAAGAGSGDEAAPFIDGVAAEDIAID